MSGLFNTLMATHAVRKAPSIYQELMGDDAGASGDDTGSACETRCPSSAPEEPPDPYVNDGVLQLYCWALVHGPDLPSPGSIPHPGTGLGRWSQVDEKHWCNGVSWARQALRCPTRPNLNTDVARHLVNTLVKVRAAPKGAKRATVNAEYERYGRRITDPLPLLQTIRLQRIAAYRLDAKRRNEKLWPSQQAFWEGVKAALVAYKIAWSNPASNADDRTLDFVMEDLVHDELYLGAKRLEK